MDAATARDFIEDLQLQLAQLLERIRQLETERALQARAISRRTDEIARLRQELRQLEAERDHWQTRAVSRD